MKAAKARKSEFSHLWRSEADRERQRDLKKDAVLRTAARLFVERGFYRTTLSDVADQLGVTKPVVYHYFDNKNALLLGCYERGAAIILAALADIEREHATGHARVVAFIRSFVKIVVVDVGACLALIDDRDLSDTDRVEIRSTKKSIELRLRDYLKQGMADGSVRACDVPMTALAIISALNGIGVWYKEGGRLTVEQVADRMAELFGQSIANTPTAASGPSRPRRTARARP